MNLEQYLPVILFILVGAVVGIAPQVLGASCSGHTGRIKKLPYECGFEAFEDARMKFDVRYYLVAILFILFRSRKSRSCFPGRWRSREIGLVRFLGHDDLPRHSGRGLCLRVEKGRPGLGMIPPQHILLASKAYCSSRKASSPKASSKIRGGQAELVQDRFALADDLWSGLLCGGDDACRCGAL